MTGYVIVGDVPDFEKPQANDNEAVEAWTEKTITFPTDYETIHEAVDAAPPGDMVYIEPGAYTETMTVRTLSLTWPCYYWGARLFGVSRRLRS
jgi:hypothetical protein